MLIDDFLADSWPVVIFEASPNYPVLTECPSSHLIPARVADTRGVMAPFDRLIVDIGAPKVI